MKATAICIVILCSVLICIFLVRPAPVDPAPYTPSPRPAMTGVLAPNNALCLAELLARGRVKGPEEIAVDPEGRVYCGTLDGTILRLLPDGKIETFAATGGRPLGLQFDPKGSLIACVADRGLIEIDIHGKMRTLATAANGVPFKLIDALDIAADGTIYFTDASWKYPLDQFMMDLLELRPHGRLMSYNPASGELRVLLEDLYFANGVALSPNEDFILVNETTALRVTRYWLKGSRAGTRDVFIDNLPGMPDNISSNRAGTFWLAIVAMRDDMTDRLMGSRFLRGMMSKLPRSLGKSARPYGLVLALDENGSITRSLHDPTGAHLKDITSAREYAGCLYLGSYTNDRIGKLKLQ